MLTARPFIAFFVAAAVGFGLSGCKGKTNQAGPAKKAGEEAHDHAHHGPHHGHLMEIGDEEYHAEWTHDESGKVTFYILDAEAKKEVPIDDDEMVIEVKIGNNSSTSFKLPAVNPQDGKSAQFETVNKELLGVLETLKSPSVVATLHVSIGDKAYDQRIEEHEHKH